MSYGVKAWLSLFTGAVLGATAQYFSKDIGFDFSIGIVTLFSALFGINLTLEKLNKN